VLLSPLGLWRDDAPIPLMEMVSGPASDVPAYLYAHPDSGPCGPRAHKRLPDFSGPSAHGRSLHMSPQG